MPATKKRVENYDRQFRVDYNSFIQQTEADKCWLVQMSDTTLKLCLSLGRFIQWGTRWHNRYDEQGNPVPAPNYPLGTGPIDDIIHNFFWELNMACNASALDRIADNLEMLVKVDDQTTVTRSITEVLAGGMGGLDFDELIQSIQDSGADTGQGDLKDFLEMMIYIKQLMPNLGGPGLFSLIGSVFQWRYRNNILNQLALINTNLRYAGLGISPPKAGSTAEDEESWIKGIYTDIDLIPWLTTGIAALAEPTPVGETALAGAIAKTVGKAVVLKLKDYIMGLFTSPPESVPEGSIVGMLEKIANAAGGGSNTTQNLTLQQIINNISAVVEDNDITDFPDIYQMLIQIQDFLPDDFGDSYKIVDPSSFIQAAILDRSLNDLREELAKIPDRLAPATENISDKLNFTEIVTQLTTLNNDKITAIAQQLVVVASRLAPADQSIKAALDALDLAPVVNVAAPAVSVTNDVPVPSVTVDVSPTPITVDNTVPVPSVTVDNVVNMDLSALETSLTAAIAQLTNLASDADNLSSLPTIATKIEDLKCICDNLAELVKQGEGYQIGASVITAQTVPVDARKCSVSKWAVGHLFDTLDRTFTIAVAGVDTLDTTISEVWSYVRLVGLISGFVTQGTSWGLTIAASGVRIFVDLVLNFTFADLQYLIGVVGNQREALMCDLYNAPDPDAARLAWRNRLEVVLSHAEAIPMIEAIFALYFDTEGIDRVFLPPDHELAVAQEEIDVYGAWALSNDCSGCVASNCPDVWRYGLPALFDGTAWTLDVQTNITPEYNATDGRYEIAWDTETARDFTIHSLPDGVGVDIWCDSCDSQTGGFFTGLTNADMPWRLSLDSTGLLTINKVSLRFSGSGTVPITIHI